MRTFTNLHTLLDNIATGLKARGAHRVANLKVQFYCDGEQVMERDLVTALDYLANDITWDVDGEWSGADEAHVEPM